MTALVFLFSVAVVFGAVLAFEVRESTPGARRPIGLFAWLTGGNWPAKIGGGLLVVGVGSLLRYGLVNFDFDASIKLGTGVLAAGVLGLAATLTRQGSARRAVSLALGGAAFGVAYLTAYSAFALFGYFDNPTGIALLALTALGAGVYAITRSALSLGLLAMLGAFLAPAFAVDDPGPEVVYGYYAAASVLALVMVALRGWRPLIHLSFLFTLVGGVFLAWTSKYYGSEHAGVMLPAILGLSGIHLLMPLVEKHTGQGVWADRLDLVYLLALPAVAALSALIIAPSRNALSNELLALAALWVAAASYLWISKREGFALHAVIAVLLLGFGAAARYRDLPWELMALAFSVGALWLAARRSRSSRMHNALAGMVPLLGFLHVVSSLSPVPGSPVFINGRFVERLIGAGLLMLAGYICRSIRQSLDTLLWSVGIGWAVIAIGSELVRWDLVSVALVVHSVFLLAGMALALTTRKSAAIPNSLLAVSLGILITTGWAATSAPAEASWVFLVLGPMTLLWLSVRRAGADRQTRAGRLLSAVLAPLVAGIWAIHVGDLAEIRAPQFSLFVAISTAVLIVLAGYLLPRRSSDWLETVAEMDAVVFAGALLVATTIVISRSQWAMALEFVSLAGLLGLAYADRDESLLPRWLAPAAALGVALLLQTHLLRWLGPAGNLDLGDIARMQLPTLVSLLWAGMGGALTVWARRKGSRPLWVAGASLLVAAAVKLVLVDFGSLGQLANILAVIAAGVVFMLVGWLAPFPPPSPPRTNPPLPDSPETPAAAPMGSASPMQRSPVADVTKPTAQESPSGSENDYWERNARKSTSISHVETASEASSNRKIAWVIAILATLVLPLAQCSRSTLDRFRHNLGFGSQVTSLQVAPSPASPTAATGAVADSPQAQAQPASSQEPITELDVASIQMETECSQWVARLPADYVIYAAGAYKGAELDFTIDDSNHRAGGFDVAVHLPARNVVLVLGAYEPSIWRVKASTATHIAGVWLSGYYAAQITGISPDTPILRSSSEQGGSCSSFYLTDGGNQRDVERAVVRTMNRHVDKVVLANNGRVAMGSTEMTPYYETAYLKSFEAFRDKSRPLAGEKGIEELLQSGQLRRARQADYDLWQSRTGRASDRTMHSVGGGGILYKVYVVQMPMVIPADLYGGNSVTFIVPRGVARPQGNPGHSQILDSNE